MNNITSRRAFLAGSGLALAAGPAGMGRPVGPGDTINLGLVGCGARGRSIFIPAFSGLPGARFVAVCDVNEKYLAEGRKLAGGDRVAAYHDYRNLMEDKNVDAVIVATNQHWHVLPTIAACQAGKDVYCEKPLGNSIGEGPFAIEAARKYRRIVQTGTQQRSRPHYAEAVKLIQSGKLGRISEVRVWDYENNWPGPGSPPDCDPPAELDWNFYVGPSPYRAYNPNMYFKYGYDWFKISGGGHQSAWGVHHYDVVLWAMGVQSPETAFASGGHFAYQSNHDWPNTFDGLMQFGPGPVAERGFVLNYSLRMGCRREMRGHGKCFIGTTASMILDRSGYSIVKEVPAGQQAVPTGSFINPEETFTATDWDGKKGDDLKHFETFLANVRERKEPFANLETCHRASNLGHLMNMAWQTGRSIRWDGKQEQVIGDPQANALVMKPYRAPWKLAV